MPSIPSSRRPGTDTTLGNHEERIRALERSRHIAATGEWVSGHDVSVVSGVGTDLTWDETLPDNEELLDLSNPLLPVLLFSGVYVVTLLVTPVFPPGITAGYGFHAGLVVVAAPGFISTATSPIGATQGPYAQGTICRPASAGDTLLATVQHNDIASRDFFLAARLELFR